MNHYKPVKSEFKKKACLLLAFLFVGCSKPCDDFAALTCSSAGEESAACAKAQKHAQRAPGIEQEVCAQALELAQTLKRK